MLKIASFLLAVALLAVLVLREVHDGPHSTPESVNPLKWLACEYAWPVSLNIQCAHFTTKDGVVLPIVVIPSAIPSDHKDPLVLLSGGPGESSQTNYESVRYWLNWLAEVQINRDLVLFDARGTGRAYPNWDCEAFDALSEQHLSGALSLRLEYQQGHRVLKDCFQQYQNLWQSLTGTDQKNMIKAINTHTNAEDTAELLTALDYSQWNLFSVSYGTRVALALAASYPKAVRSVILDSPYPPGKGLAHRRAEWTQHAIELFLRACVEGEICIPAVADIESIFMQVLRQLRQTPITMEVNLWSKQQKKTFILNNDRLLFLVFYALYDESIYQELIKALVDLHQGNTKTIEPLAEMFVNTLFDKGFNTMVNLATDCNDNPLSKPENYVTDKALYPELQDWMLIEAKYNVCQWPLFKPGSLNIPLEAISAPILILNGEFDPATPEVWGRELHRQLPTSQRILVTHAGHSILTSGLCHQSLISDFLDRPTHINYSEVCKH